MGRKSITGGVMPAGPAGIQFDFRIAGRRFRPTLPWIPHETNLRRARAYLARIKAQIAAGTFCFADEFPRYKGLSQLPPPHRARTCGEVFDAFLRHEEARLARGDLAPVTVASHRKILDHVWRPHLGCLPLIGIPYSLLVQIADAYPCNKKTYNNAISALRRAFEFGYLDCPDRRDPAASLKCARLGKKDRPPIDPFSIQDAEVFIAALHRDWGDAYAHYDELRFFTGLRPSEEIALVVTDYDAAHGVLSITKARVNGIDQDVTKTGEDRRIVLCPRAVAILERQLRLRERAVAAGLIHHEALFFTNAGAPIQQLGYGYWRWQRTLKRLGIRYRKPYVARHTSVSWNLMVGRNPLLVAKEHGHRLTTMLSVYAAWAEGAAESDIIAIREAMNRTAPPAGRPDHRLQSSGGGVTAPLGSASQPATGSRRRAPVLAPKAAEFAAPATPADPPSAALPPAGPGPLGSRLVSGGPPATPNWMKSKENAWWKGRDSNPRPRHYEGRRLT
jgi:integrase